MQPSEVVLNNNKQKSQPAQQHTIAAQPAGTYSKLLNSTLQLHAEKNHINVHSNTRLTCAKASFSTG